MRTTADTCMSESSQAVCRAECPTTTRNFEGKSSKENSALSSHRAPTTCSPDCSSCAHTIPTQHSASRCCERAQQCARVTRHAHTNRTDGNGRNDLRRADATEAHSQRWCHARPTRMRAGAERRVECTLRAIFGAQRARVQRRHASVAAESAQIKRNA